MGLGDFKVMIMNGFPNKWVSCMQIVKLFYYLFGIFVIPLSFIWSINISNLAKMVLWSVEWDGVQIWRSLPGALAVVIKLISCRVPLNCKSPVGSQDHCMWFSFCNCVTLHCMPTVERFGCTKLGYHSCCCSNDKWSIH